jgi:aminobenzoyl-glutamate utilization protein B
MRRNPGVALLLLVLSVAVSAQRPSTDDRAAMLQSIDAKRSAYAEVARQIWGFAEVGYQEEKSSALLQRQLRAAGFDVTAHVADIPTAFVATFGSGKPVIAIVGEFDALPGLSQEAMDPSHKPIVAEAPGHGCGHNLLGTGALASAIAVKNWLVSSHHAGTLRYYGTPAEEGGSGKVYMVRDGLFKDVDAVVSWHPGDRNEASPTSSTANITAKFRFHGLAAHAAAAPERGRSALDAVEAMDYMVNMMREHVPQETRIHYIITRGGAAPNVVPDFAEAYYYARHPDMRILDGIWERMVNAAKGAALGTGTTMELEVTGAVYNILPNEYLSTMMNRNLQRVGGLYTTRLADRKPALDYRK